MGLFKETATDEKWNPSPSTTIKQTKKFVRLQSKCSQSSRALATNITIFRYSNEFTYHKRCGQHGQKTVRSYSTKLVFSTPFVKHIGWGEMQGMRQQLARRKSLVEPIPRFRRPKTHWREQRHKTMVRSDTWNLPLETFSNYQLNYTSVYVLLCLSCYCCLVSANFKLRLHWNRKAHKHISIYRWATRTGDPDKF